MVVIVYGINRCGNRACIINICALFVWDWRIRHVSELFNNHFTLVSRKRNRTFINMGWYRVSDRLCHCPAYHHSAGSFLWLAHAILCKCTCWCNMGIVLFFWFRNFPSEMRNIPAKERQYIEADCRFSSRQHLIPFRVIFKNRTLWALMFMYFCCQWANYFFVAWMPVYLQEGRHFSEDETKPIIFTLFITGIIGFLAGGFFGDWIVKRKGLRFGRRFVGMTGLGMCGLMIFLFGTYITK